MVRALGSQLTGVGFESSKSHWWQQEKYPAQAASVSYKKALLCHQHFRRPFCHPN